MTTKRIDSERVRAYTQALMDAASAGGRSERDLQQSYGAEISQIASRSQSATVKI